MNNVAECLAEVKMHISMGSVLNYESGSGTGEEVHPPTSGWAHAGTPMSSDVCRVQSGFWQSFLEFCICDVYSKPTWVLPFCYTKCLNYLFTQVDKKVNFHVVFDCGAHEFQVIHITLKSRDSLLI